MSNAYDQLVDEVVGTAMVLDEAERLHGDELIRYVLRQVVQARAETERTLRDIRHVVTAGLVVTVAIAAKLVFTG
jgi:hypothetical protein